MEDYDINRAGAIVLVGTILGNDFHGPSFSARPLCGVRSAQNWWAEAHPTARSFTTRATDSMSKSFLVLFFKKELLP
jgi:hypothetical protein